MSPFNAAALVNFLGFTVGAALYAMLLGMVLRRPARVAAKADAGRGHSFLEGNGLLLATAVLGLVWNAGALAGYGLQSLSADESLPLLAAVSFAALGFLPAVVVHSALRGRGAEARGEKWLKLTAYGLSALAAVLHLRSALADGSGASDSALRYLTAGYLVLIAALFVSTRRQPGWQRVVWASALSVFAVSALHLSHHPAGGGEVWSIGLLGHHASIPLALAILYQDYRFAFADIFLKRALALLLLVAVACGLYVVAAAPLLAVRDESGQLDPRAVGGLLGLWVVSALLYPSLRRAAVWFVDKVLLRRADYGELRAELARSIGERESPEAVLDEACRVIAPALTAGDVSWSEVRAAEGADERPGHAPASRPAEVLRPSDGPAASHAGVTLQTFARGPAARLEENVFVLEGSRGAGAVVAVPTAEPPFYQLLVGGLAGGRRLLSDDLEMLEAVAQMTARRIDFLRVAHERCEQTSREQEISKLAAEAQLRALRAQVNPHFLFNALTTIGYLIKAAPDRALDTLLKLTDLLRRVLRSTGEYVTLGEELKLIASYLDIERERFEERLRVRVEAPEELLGLRLPSLIVQPLVENAIKHGITPSRFGGEVVISARVEGAGGPGSPGETLLVTVSDTGKGASEDELARGRKRGLGLNNIEERLRCYCGSAGRLEIRSAEGAGTTVEIRLPVAEGAGRAQAAADGARAAAGR
jgi:signal transduction histidine kinase